MGSWRREGLYWGGSRSVGAMMWTCCSSTCCRRGALYDTVMLLFQRPACQEKTWPTTIRAATVSLCPRIWPRGWRSPSGPSGRNRWSSRSFTNHSVWSAHHSSLYSLFICCWWGTLSAFYSHYFLFVFIYFAHPRVKGRHQLLGKTSQCDLQLASLFSDIGSSSSVSGAVCPTESCSVLVVVEVKLKTSVLPPAGLQQSSPIKLIYILLSEPESG